MSPLVNKAFIAAEAIDLILAEVIQEQDRLNIFARARQEANRLNLPLVNYGCQTSEPYISQSDLNLDIIQRNVPNFELIPPDGQIPLPDNSAVIFASHVLEHVNNPDKVLEDMTRVGPTYIALPKWWNIQNWISPRHKWLFTKYGAIATPSEFALPLFIGINLLNLST